MNGSINQLTQDAIPTTLPYKGQPHLLPPIVRTASQHMMQFKLDYKPLLTFHLHYSMKIKYVLWGKKKQGRCTLITHTCLELSASLNVKTLSAVFKHEPHTQVTFFFHLFLLVGG